MKMPAAWFLTLPAIALAQQTAVHVYPIPATISAPGTMIPGPQRSVWFTDGPQIGRITPSGEITQFPTPPPWDVSSMTTGPDGAIWFIPANGDAIGRMTTSGEVTEYPLPQTGDPQGIAAGADGALWFTDYSLNEIGRITTDGVFSYFVVPTPQAGVTNIAKGPGNTLWFLEEFGNNVGRITTDGVVTEFPLPAANGDGGLYCCITEGSDGAMWFDVPGFFTPSFIGRITAAGAITEYPMTDQPQGITPGPDGALYFITNAGIGRITTAGAVSFLPGHGGAITQGPDHELWLTSAVGYGGSYTPGVIEEMVFESASLTVTPDSGPPGETLQFAGSGFAPDETVQIYTRGVGSRVLATAQADGNGAIAVSAEAPESPYLFGDTNAFLATGQSSGNLGAAPFTSTSRLKLTPDSGPAGSTVTLTGYGFGPYEYMDIFWVNSSTVLGNVTADVNGTFDGSAGLQFTVPADATPGTYLVKAYARFANHGGHIQFTVE